jgi:hypothetical protein
LCLISSCSFSTLTVTYSLNIGARIEVWSSVTIVDVSSTSAAIYGIAKEEIIAILAKEGIITRATIYAVITILAKEAVTTRATNDAIIVIAAREKITTVEAIDEVITRATKDGVRTRTTAYNVIST